MMRDELKDRAISLLKDTYAIGYEDGVKATNVDCGVVWEEKIDEIKAEIDEQYKWLIQTNHTLYDIDIAFNCIQSFIDKHIGGGKDEDNTND